MLRVRTFIAGLVAALTLAVPCTVKAAEPTQQEKLNQLQKELDDIRKQLNEPARAVRSDVDRALDNKYGPDAKVQTRTGKLTISVLTQVWYQGFQHDTQGLFNDPVVNGVFDTNAGRDNNSFVVRRTELKFTMDLTENIRSVVMIDPAREITSNPLLTDNQANDNTIFVRKNQVAPEFNALNGPGLGNTTAVSNVQFGSGAVPRLLQDAYIGYHGVIPHHDFISGQFKPFFGEEGIRSSAQLDFIERSFVGLIQDNRDLGSSVHGTWWDDRFQYWGGIYDGAGNYYLSAGNQTQNRSDDNDDKDYAVRALIRPLWSDEKWYGRLELGGSGQMGRHGKGGNQDPIANPVSGLNRASTWAQKYDVWAYYAPNSFAKGLWVRSEWLNIYDRNAPRNVIDVQGNGNADDGLGGGGTLRQTNGKPFNSYGYYVALGYRVPDECGRPEWLKNLEFAGRFDTFQNVQVANLVRNDHTDVFFTKVWTAGINYYIKGNNAKLQLNYNFVENPQSHDPNRIFHNVKNDSFAVAFQVYF